VRVKAVPTPAGLDPLAEAHRAVPLVPAPEDDCCIGIQRRLDLSDRDAALTWLTFLRGLGLVRAGQRGFVRVRRDPDRDVVAEGLLAGVFLAREVHDALGTHDASDPLTVDAAFAAVEDRVPRWERARDPGWRETWRARVEHLLGWLVVVGRARRAESGFVPA